MAFTPMDVRGPDRRRKQLLSLIQQQQTHSPTAFGQPHPPKAMGGGFLGAAGRPMYGGRASAPRQNFTHPSDIAQSILASLGAMGQAGGRGEVSPGMGLPIPAQHQGSPYAPQQGSPIPAYPGPPSGGSLPSSSLLPPPGTGHDPGMTLPAQQPQFGTSLGSVPSAPPAPAQTSAGLDSIAPGSFASKLGGVPLGGGLVYDPSTDTVINSGATGGNRHFFA